MPERPTASSAPPSPHFASPLLAPVRQAAVLVATLLLAACGGGEPEPAAEAEGTGETAEGVDSTVAEVGDTLEVTDVDPLAASEPPPDTDIYLARLQDEGPGPRLVDARNVTARPGYDNQPHFLPDGSGFLYTAVDDAGQADTWRWALGADVPVRVTTTSPESEYSPTPLPSGDGFSAVRVEADSTQRLWRFALDGSSPEVILPDVEPVGYHAWSGERTLLLFVLGDPPTLQVADTVDGSVEVVARDIGRALRPIPGTEAVSFVQVGAGGGTRIMRWDPVEGITPIVEALDDGDPHAWTPDGTLLMGSGSRVMAWRPDVPDRGWVEAGDLASLGVGAVTRLAVSPDGAWIAVVGEARR